jgi:selenide,water dikinase
LGTGVIATAIKKGKAEKSWVEDATKSMITLNRAAAEFVAGSGVNAQRQSSSDRFSISTMTDITGFGLIGHVRELALASNLSMRISASRIPALEGALNCIRAGHIPGGLTNNRDFAECLVEYDPGVPDDVRTLLYDPQTSGGLLISTPDGPGLMKGLIAAGVPAVQIGEVRPRTKPTIEVVV